MGRKRKSPEKPKKGLGRRARKQQPPEIPAYLEAKGSLGLQLIIHALAEFFGHW